jgi:hypothetical protein
MCLFSGTLQAQNTGDSAFKQQAYIKVNILSKMVNNLPLLVKTFAGLDSI